MDAFRQLFCGFQPHTEENIVIGKRSKKGSSPPKKEESDRIQEIRKTIGDAPGNLPPTPSPAKKGLAPTLVSQPTDQLQNQTALLPQTIVPGAENTPKPNNQAEGKIGAVAHNTLPTHRLSREERKEMAAFYNRLEQEQKVLEEMNHSILTGENSPSTTKEKAHLVRKKKQVQLPKEVKNKLGIKSTVLHLTFDQLSNRETISFKEWSAATRHWFKQEIADSYDTIYQDERQNIIDDMKDCKDRQELRSLRMELKTLDYNRNQLDRDLLCAGGGRGNAALFASATEAISKASWDVMKRPMSDPAREIEARLDEGKDHIQKSCQSWLKNNFPYLQPPVPSNPTKEELRELEEETQARIEVNRLYDAFIDVIQKVVNDPEFTLALRKLAMTR